MPRYKLAIEYAGTRYSGWQKQKNARTVQGEIERAIGELTRDRSFEFYGSGLDSMALPDRATIANMASEYGATMGFFPVDAETIAYLRFSGRSDEQVRLVEE